MKQVQKKRKLSDLEIFLNMMEALGFRKTWKRSPVTKVERDKKKVYKRSSNKSIDVLSAGDDNDGDYL